MSAMTSFLSKRLVNKSRTRKSNSSRHLHQKFRAISWIVELNLSVSSIGRPNTCFVDTKLYAVYTKTIKPLKIRVGLQPRQWVNRLMFAVMDVF